MRKRMKTWKKLTATLMAAMMTFLTVSPVGASVKADRETHGLISQEVVPDATEILFGELNEETGSEAADSETAAGEELLVGDGPVATDEFVTFLKVSGLDESYLPGEYAPDVSSVSVKMVDAYGKDKVIEDGNIEYWECTDPECGKLFADEAGNTEIHISDTIIPAGKTEPEPHPAPGELKLTHHAAVAPTMEKDGMAEYWEDTETGKLYADAEGKNEVKDKTSLIIPISSVYNVTNVKIDGCSISMNVVMVKSVSYNGTKHVTKLSK